MTAEWVNLALTNDPDMDTKKARKLLDVVKAEVRDAVKILTAEQALKAQRVVREAGRARH